MNTGQIRNDQPVEDASSGGDTIRILIAIAIVLLVMAYTGSVLIGVIPAERKLGAADIAILFVSGLTVAILLNPRLLERLSRFKFGNVEFELQRLQQVQQAQRGELDGLRFVLTMLLQPGEIRHLKDLSTGKVTNRTGSHNLRTELRKLRAMGLIRSIQRKKIADLKDGIENDLKNFVELTERGLQYLARLGDGEEESE